MTDEPARHRVPGGDELLVDPVDEERAQRPVGDEVGRRQADDDQAEDDEQQAAA
jgi:hypothetical protein